MKGGGRGAGEEVVRIDYAALRCVELRNRDSSQVAARAITPGPIKYI